ncbi:bifunctional 5,10-methylenetetrahydrofolate dehydrogenase/5,10-methenyltetrahydrofolate cyclohydrolase [Gordonia terrae]|uniref:bifunctional 5,10-methylenetetrahydrofolate dehydrogenase/5,10-methenyltetrahydrofolate cyclohydrolase n=1 Tax=Gordonia terrae TaxID=2055 RepID=UPI003F6C01DA
MSNAPFSREPFDGTARIASHVRATPQSSSRRIMTAQIIDGVAIARQVREGVRSEVTRLVESGFSAPGLATVLIGDDPASEVYVRNKRRASVAAGMSDLHQHLSGDVSQSAAVELIDELATDPRVSGILLQLPTPGHLDSAALIERIPASKDVDGLTTENAGKLLQGKEGIRPCTPSGVLSLLDSHHVPLTGADVVVVGRSELVGKPMAQLLLGRDATVTVCHSRTRDLVSVCRTADVLVVAAGVPDLIDGSAIKPGATVIDVGIHRGPNGLSGDVHYHSAVETAGLITPVPGGVGPMTIATLLANTVTAAKMQQRDTASDAGGSGRDPSTAGA